MKRWALIQGETVSLVTEQDSKPTISGTWVECPINVGPTWRYENGEFLPPIIDEPL